MAEQTIELIPGIDTKIVLDELYYTIKGAMKKLNFGRNKILGFVEDGSLETYVHGNGADLFTVSKLLGHTKITTTQIYAKVLDEGRKKAVDAIPEL